jgi:hypothetical protein
LERRPFSAGDVDAHIALARTEYTEANVTDADHIRWKFLDFPEGPARATVLMADGQLVGRLMRQARPFYFSADEAALKGAQIGDLIIAPEHRRADVFIRLLRAGSEISDVDLILHGSNETSDPLYRKLFKYPIAFSLTARGFPIRLARPLRKLAGFGPAFLDVLAWPWRALLRATSWAAGGLARLDLKPGSIPEGELDGIYAGFEKFAGPHYRRDGRFARWRFESGPLYNAKLHRISAGGRLVGYVALRDVDFEGVRICAIIDIALVRPLKGLEGFALAMKMLARGSARADAVVTLANFANPVLRKAVGFPFVTIPERMLPHANPIYALVNGDKTKRLPALAGTFMTLADIDFF